MDGGNPSPNNEYTYLNAPSIGIWCMQGDRGKPFGQGGHETDRGPKDGRTRLSPHTGGNTPWNGRNASGMVLCDYYATRGSEANDNAYKGHLMNDNVNGQPNQRTRLSTLGGGRLDVGVQQTGWVLVVDGSPAQGGVVSIWHHLWEQVAEPTKPPARRLSTEVGLQDKMLPSVDTTCTIHCTVVIHPNSVHTKLVEKHTSYQLLDVSKGSPNLSFLEV